MSMLASSDNRNDFEDDEIESSTSVWLKRIAIALVALLVLGAIG